MKRTTRPLSTRPRRFDSDGYDETLLGFTLLLVSLLFIFLAAAVADGIIPSPF